MSNGIFMWLILISNVSNLWGLIVYNNKIKEYAIWNYNLSGRIKTLIMFEQMQLVLAHSTRTSAVLTFACGSLKNRDLLTLPALIKWFFYKT